jgi:predicted alpha/beta-hydrolase family hydrolase
MLGHSAGGGVDAPDLVAAKDVALRGGWAVARVTQPYRVLGRRAPAPAAQLDSAWVATAHAIRHRVAGLADVPLIVGGRSSGARVACRTAEELAAVGVLALAFPLHPPGRPAADRSDELRRVAVSLLIVQGDRDAFGSSVDIAGLELPDVEVVGVADADHSLRRATAINAVSVALGSWLPRFSP